MKAHLAKLSLALLSVAFLLGCQEQGSDPVGPDGLGPEFVKKGVNCADVPPHPSCPGTTDPDGDAETFDVTIRTCNELVAGTDADRKCKIPGNIWTATNALPLVEVPQEVQTNNAKNWLHIFDSGGNGTRGNPKYPGAFSTKIFLQPTSSAGANCVDQDGTAITDDNNLLFGKLNQLSQLVVFDFQVGYDIATNPEGFSFFLFRWKDGDQIFSASTGFGFDGSEPAPTIVFLHDNDGGNGAIDDPTETRVFRISGAKVIAKELRRNKVIAMVACNNQHMIEVTVAPI